MSIKETQTLQNKATVQSYRKMSNRNTKKNPADRGCAF